ncbi:MAG: DUF2088 domain-containing protein [Clostridia bacterium]|nr:DUF2088 domain-containing protein [Clostridia bacterium]
MNIIDKLLEDVAIPKMVKIEQVFDHTNLGDVVPALRAELARPKITGSVKPGMKVAVACGSRGITSIDTIAREVVAFLKSQGAEPFIVPAMGSHGGATPEGQAEMLAGYGITEAAMGCPIRSSMEVVRIGALDDGQDVYIDRNAYEADGIVLINRVKLHPGFAGRYQSGLMKMMTIGLGKQYGADKYHSKNVDYLQSMIANVGAAVLKFSPVLFGVAVVENSYKEIRELHVLHNDEIVEKEPEILLRSATYMPRIMFPGCDVLIVDEIGKNICGPGADAHITGRFPTHINHGKFSAQAMLYMDLTEETHGNGNGMGQADVITQKLLDKVDLQKTYPNALTGKIFNNAKIPLTMPSDLRAIQAGIKYAVDAEPGALRIVRIKNTVKLSQIWISEAMAEEAGQDPNIRILTEPMEMEFDEDGNFAASSKDWI